MNFIFENATKGNAKSVVDKIDEFCYKGDGLMNVGDIKGEIVEKEIMKCKPKVLLFNNIIRSWLKLVDILDIVP